jgi:hypothetical protein
MGRVNARATVAQATSMNPMASKNAAPGKKTSASLWVK